MLKLCTIVGISFLIGLLGAAGRQDHSGGSGTQYEFFSGHIADLADDQVTVERMVLGKNRERRVFTIVSDTKIEGTLKKSARVTVGFLQADNRDEAYRIIVRAEK